MRRTHYSSKRSAEPINPFIHSSQDSHSGQAFEAATVLEALAGSRSIRDELGGVHEHRTQDLIQDRYSMRCLPQFLGPIVEGIELMARQLEIEINSANDNPLIDVDAQASFHGGNFLGEYVAIGMDQLRYYIGLIAKHLDVQIAMLVTLRDVLGVKPSRERPYIRNDEQALDRHIHFIGDDLAAGSVIRNALMPSV